MNDADKINRYFYRWTIESRLELLSEYLQTLSALLEESKTQLVESLEKEAQQIDNEDNRNLFYETHLEDVTKVEDDYPQLMYSGFIVTWYSFVEQRLTALCKLLNLEITLSISDTERLGEGVDRAYQFWVFWEFSGSSALSHF